MDEKRKRRKKKSHYALLIAVIASALLFSGFSFVMKDRLYADYEYDALNTPILALMMSGIRDGVYPWSAPKQKTGPASYDTQVVIDGIIENSETVPVETGSEIPSENTSEIPGEPPVEELVPDNTPKEFTTVDDEYFNDAIFIGDSRLVGLSEYCEPIDTRADFYVKRSMTIYDLLNGKEAKFNGENKSVWEVLDSKQYGKIYIQVGINEIGTGTPEYFRNAYAQFLDLVCQKQPDAIIFINSIMHVTARKSNSDKLYNNPNINLRNEAIAPLADNIRIFYIDVNENVDDENGGMRLDLSYDDVHLLGSCYEPFHQSLLTHGIK